MADYYFYKKFIGKHTEKEKFKALNQYYKWKNKYMALK